MFSGKVRAAHSASPNVVLVLRGFERRLRRHKACPLMWLGDSDMAESVLDLPLRFKGHSAFLRTKPETGIGWQVTTYIDGRVVGKVHRHNWRQVELYRERVQMWLKVAEGVERLWPSAA